MEAINLLHIYSPKTEINVLSIILQENLDDIIPLVKWAQGNEKINLINLLGLIQPRGKEKDDVWHQKEESSILWPHNKAHLCEILDTLIEMKKYGFPKIGNPITQLLNYKKYYSTPDQYIRSYIPCTIGYLFLSVNERGNVSLCEEMDSIGNVCEHDIYDIWFSKEAEEIRKEIRQCSRNCHQIINCCYEEEVRGEGKMHVA